MDNLSSSQVEKSPELSILDDGAPITDPSKLELNNINDDVIVKELMKRVKRNQISSSSVNAVLNNNSALLSGNIGVSDSFSNESKNIFSNVTNTLGSVTQSSGTTSAVGTLGQLLLERDLGTNSLVISSRKRDLSDLLVGIVDDPVAGRSVLDYMRSNGLKGSKCNLRKNILQSHCNLEYVQFALLKQIEKQLMPQLLKRNNGAALIAKLKESRLKLIDALTTELMAGVSVKTHVDRIAALYEDGFGLDNNLNIYEAYMKVSNSLVNIRPVELRPLSDISFSSTNSNNINKNKSFGNSSSILPNINVATPGLNSIAGFGNQHNSLNNYNPVRGSNMYNMYMYNQRKSQFNYQRPSKKLCFEFNLKGKCKFSSTGTCRFGHRCMTCGGDHPAKDCAKNSK